MVATMTIIAIRARFTWGADSAAIVIGFPLRDGALTATLIVNGVL
jgi:hypothetical protein